MLTPAYPPHPDCRAPVLFRRGSGHYRPDVCGRTPDTFQYHPAFQARHCFEVGTFTGGGSTFIIASAFKEIGAGKLFTLESNKALFSLATAAYKAFAPELLAHVEFINGGNVELFASHIRASEGVEAFFLDGAENADQTLDQYCYFLPHLGPGAVMMAHDWHTVKMMKVRPVIESDPQWEFLLELAAPYSVGFVVLQRR